MGVISSKLFDKPSTRATLEKIEQELQNIEERRWDKVKREQFVVQILSFLPATIFIVNLCILIYPSGSSWRDKIILSVPATLVNIILIVCRKMVQWYSRWSLDNEETRLRKLQKEKRRILEMVCETESYRVATELLEKYDPKQLRRRERPISPLDGGLTKFTASPLKTPRESANIQKSKSFSQHSLSKSKQQTPSNQQPAPRILNQSFHIAAPHPPAPPPPTPVAKHQPRADLNSTVTNASHNTSMTVAASSVQGRPVRPILSKDRTIFEKVVDWVIADGPDNRFALICRYCYGHNGMSLAEEFETINFRCCYCYLLNTSTNKRQVHDQLQPDREKSESNATTKEPTVNKEQSDIAPSDADEKFEKSTKEKDSEEKDEFDKNPI